MCSSLDLRLTTSLRVQIEPKKDIVYLRGKSKFMVLSCRIITTSVNEKDAEYVAPDTTTPAIFARAIKGTFQKVVPGVVTASQFEKERTLTYSPFGVASRYEGASDSESNFAYGSAHYSGSNADSSSSSASQKAARS